MPLLPRHPTENDDPPSPAEYLVLLILLVVAGVGYITWRRVKGVESFPLEPLAGPLRLSTDDDGPTSESFIHNASTDSLPALADRDIPFLAQYADAEAAPPAYDSHRDLGAGAANAQSKPRRSARAAGTRSSEGEGRDSDGSEDGSGDERDEQDEQDERPVFSLGDEDDRD
ncbi:OTU protein [Vanrija albida]|uniref:OTU protein n=1 Tax=Vanrija albida TaxID=181172 RepID=A0ABR3Q591_9TREE